MLKARTRKMIANRTAKAPVAERSSARATHSRVCLGVLVAWDDEGPSVEFEGNARGPLRARLAGAAPHARPTLAGPPQEVVLLIDARRGQPPVLLGVLQAFGSEGQAEQVEARVDGRRVEIDGRDEIVLRCGEASITLRRNGRIVIRGVQVESRAAGVNRIKGGSVAIN